MTARSFVGLMLKSGSAAVRRVLDRTLADGHGRRVTIAEAVLLLDAKAPGDVAAVTAVADALRSETCGNSATFVVNRNINFTNACVKRCGFCAFSRTGVDSEAYFLPIDEVLRRAKQAVALGIAPIARRFFPFEAHCRPSTGTSRHQVQRKYACKRGCPIVTSTAGASLAGCTST